MSSDTVGTRSCRRSVSSCIGCIPWSLVARTSCSRAPARWRRVVGGRSSGSRARPGAEVDGRARSWRRSASRARLVPMDGFHLAQPELVRLWPARPDGRPGHVRLRAATRRCSPACARDEPVVYAPEFRREIEEPIAGPIAVPRQTPLVVTEGNYLLLWPDIQPLLDECWYVETDEELRVQRLIQRHIQFGKTPEYARAWVLRSDEHNARVVAETANRADVLVRLGDPRTDSRVARSSPRASALQGAATVDHERLARDVGRTREARNATTSATSSGVPGRPAGVLAPARSSSSVDEPVAIQPGATLFTVTPRGPSSSANARVSPSTPAFAALYAAE